MNRTGINFRNWASTTPAPTTCPPRSLLATARSAHPQKTIRRLTPTSLTSLRRAIKRILWANSLARTTWSRRPRISCMGTTRAPLMELFALGPRKAESWYPGKTTKQLKYRLEKSHSPPKSIKTAFLLPTPLYKTSTPSAPLEYNLQARAVRGSAVTAHRNPIGARARLRTSPKSRDRTRIYRLPPLATTGSRPMMATKTRLQNRRVTTNLEANTGAANIAPTKLEYAPSVPGDGWDRPSWEHLTYHPVRPIGPSFPFRRRTRSPLKA